MNTIDPPNPGPYSDAEWREICRADREAERAEHERKQAREAKSPPKKAT